MQDPKQKGAAVAAILKEMEADIRLYPGEIVQMMYARQLEQLETGFALPGREDQDPKKTEEDRRRMEKMTEEGKLKWAYASESQKKKVSELEAIIDEYNQKIKKLYE